MNWLPLAFAIALHAAGAPAGVVLLGVVATVALGMLGALRPSRG